MGTDSVHSSLPGVVIGGEEEGGVEEGIGATVYKSYIIYASYILL